MKGEPGFVRIREDHKCMVPGNPMDYGLKTVWRCSCGRRFTLVNWVGQRQWMRRYLPWPR